MEEVSEEVDELEVGLKKILQYAKFEVNSRDIVLTSQTDGHSSFEIEWPETDLPQTYDRSPIDIRGLAKLRQSFFLFEGNEWTQHTNLKIYLLKYKE